MIIVLTVDYASQFEILRKDNISFIHYAFKEKILYDENRCCQVFNNKTHIYSVETVIYQNYNWDIVRNLMIFV